MKAVRIHPHGGQAVLKGHDLGYEVAVLEDACAAFTEDQRKVVLKNIVHHFGECITVDEFIKRTQRS